jgi:hypothetical protein
MAPGQPPVGSAHRRPACSWRAPAPPLFLLDAPPRRVPRLNADRVVVRPQKKTPTNCILLLPIPNPPPAPLAQHVAGSSRSWLLAPVAPLPAVSLHTPRNPLYLLSSPHPPRLTSAATPYVCLRRKDPCVWSSHRPSATKLLLRLPLPRRPAVSLAQSQTQNESKASVAHSQTHNHSTWVTRVVESQGPVAGHGSRQGSAPPWTRWSSSQAGGRGRSTGPCREASGCSRRRRNNKPGAYFGSSAYL